MLHGCILMLRITFLVFFFCKALQLLVFAALGREFQFVPFIFRMLKQPQQE